MLSAVVVVAFGVGFLILPATHQHRDQMSMKDNISHALGHHVHGRESMVATTPETIPTYIVWDEATIHEALNGDSSRGEFIATNCTACHGEYGVTTEKWIPNLAGVNRIVLYKELADFRSETRLSEPMSAIAQALTPQQAADVSAYFSSLSGGIVADAIHAPESGRSLRAKDPTLRLIYAGDPKRGLAGCATCHGPGAYRMGVPSISGQNADYIEQQLHNFAQGVRRNDMNMPMRTVAGMLTNDEMHSLAQDFSMGTSRVRYPATMDKGRNEIKHARKTLGRKTMRKFAIVLIFGGSLLLAPTGAHARDGATGKKRALGKELVAPGTQYSPGVLLGNTIYVAGLQGTDASTHQLPSDFGQEVRNCLDNVGRVLKDGGMKYDDVVSVQIFLVDISQFQQVNEIYKGYFKDILPARTTVQIAKLSLGSRIEISAIAQK